MFALVVLSNGALCNVQPVFDPIPLSIRISQPIHLVTRRAFHELLVLQRIVNGRFSSGIFVNITGKARSRYSGW
jgi:hypothetical protein